MPTEILPKCTRALKGQANQGQSNMMDTFIVAESVKDFVDVLETLDEFRYFPDANWTPVPFISIVSLPALESRRSLRAHCTIDFCYIMLF